MAGRLTDRKGKSKDAKSISEPVDSFANFTLPECFSAEEVNFPPLLTRKVTANWKQILEESQQFQNEAKDHADNKQEAVLKAQFKNKESDYIKEEIFPYLLPAIEETLNKAKIWDVFIIQKSFFNGIDWIAQILWNNNPRHPDRANNPQHLFNMPWVRELLKKKPRPYFPKSWLWTEDYAATMIQKTVRQYFVQREEEVQEMREFWRKIKMGRTLPEIGINPLLARKFASTRSLIPRK